MHRLILIASLVAAMSAHAEGNYDPFSSKDPKERANAAQMRDAIVKGDWKGAEKFATTDALRRLYKEAKIEYSAPEKIAPATTTK
jgi:hypothetical protein